MTDKSTLASFIGVLMILLGFGLAYSCEAYKFRDCKKVGHSTLYCIMQVGD